MMRLNYSDIFAKYEEQGWNENSKFHLLLNFLDLHSNTIVTPRLFDDYLSRIQMEENSLGENSIQETFSLGINDGLESEELTSGMTYEDQAFNEAYDHGVNVGQAIRFMQQTRIKDESSPTRERP